MLFRSVWFTDGYGDYVRHYLRAMAYMPELAPAAETHILHSTAPLMLVNYAGNHNKMLGEDVPYKDVDKVSLYYHCVAKSGIQTIKTPARPSKVLVGKKEIYELQSLDKEGFTWKNGLLKVRHENAIDVMIYQ